MPGLNWKLFTLTFVLCSFTLQWRTFSHLYLDLHSYMCPSHPLFFSHYSSLFLCYHAIMCFFQATISVHMLVPVFHLWVNDRRHAAQHSIVCKNHSSKSGKGQKSFLFFSKQAYQISICILFTSLLVMQTNNVVHSGMNVQTF